MKSQHKKNKRPNRETVKYSRSGNGWKLGHYPKTEYMDLGWDLPFGIEPKIKDQKLKRHHRKRRQRKDLRTHLRMEE